MGDDLTWKTYKYRIIKVLFYVDSSFVFKISLHGKLQIVDSKILLYSRSYRAGGTLQSSDLTKHSLYIDSSFALDISYHGKTIKIG